MSARLKIVKGGKAGAAFDLDGELFIGRDAGNDIVVADHTASRHHVKVSIVNGRILVKDLGSNNGMFVNGAKAQEAVLKENDVLLVGKTLFVLESGEQTQAEGLVPRRDRTVVSSVVCRPSRACSTPGVGRSTPPSRGGEGQGEGGADNGMPDSPMETHGRSTQPLPRHRDAKHAAGMPVHDLHGTPIGPAAGEVKLVGNSPAFKRALEMAMSAAAASSPVLLTGESGTGKELFARFIHAGSERYDCPFVALNCAALPETLLENELFGHVKGAFTGAENTCPGKFELAHTGTIFLDEIGDCSPSLQAKLLRAVEQKEFFPVGSNKAKRVDVRIVAASNRALEKAIEEGKFRNDLYYRLNVLAIKLPPLRERADDIPFLAYRFLEESCAETKRNVKGFSNEALEALKHYAWPGNVRELANVVERAVVLCKGENIGPADLPAEVGGAGAAGMGSGVAHPGEDAIARLMTFEEAEKALVIKALKHTGGKKGEAAKLLGISWPTLNKKIADYEIEV